MKDNEDQVDLTPRTEDESHAAMRAVYEERLSAEHDALVEALTDRERLMIAEAWWRGAQEARADLSKRLASPHAATLDADAVARTVDTWRSTSERWQPRAAYRLAGSHYDKRLVSLVRYLKEVEATPGDAQ